MMLYSHIHDASHIPKYAICPTLSYILITNVSLSLQQKLLHFISSENFHFYIQKSLQKISQVHTPFSLNDKRYLWNDLLNYT